MDLIVDLDGTVADCDWRLHHIKNKPKNWKAFFAGISQDQSIEPLAEIIANLYFNSLCRVIYCTGRPENFRPETERWIEIHLGGDCSHLYMRPAGDHRPDYVTKRDLLYKMREDGFAPTMAIDDKPEVCEMFKNEGLLVLQVLRKPNVQEVA
jgi:hypothetical protein